MIRFMDMKMDRLFFSCWWILLLLVLFSLGSCQSKEKATSSYPNKPITYIVPWAPGGMTDLSSRMIEYARSQSRDAEIRNVRFVHADANRILSDGPFDTILAFSFLHLVSDIQETLSAIHAQLKPGGLFISKTVCIAERNFGIRSMVRLMSAAPFTPDVNLLSQSTLGYLIQRAGFDVIETRYFGDQSMDPFIVARRRG